MATSEASLISGEIRLIGVYLKAGTGTVSASGCTFTLYDSAQGIVSGFNAVAATADPPAAIVKVQFLLNTAGLAPGRYTGLFSMPATTSADGITQTPDADVDIFINPAP